MSVVKEAAISCQPSAIRWGLADHTRLRRPKVGQEIQKDPLKLRLNGAPAISCQPSAIQLVAIGPHPATASECWTGKYKKTRSSFASTGHPLSAVSRQLSAGGYRTTPGYGDRRLDREIQKDPLKLCFNGAPAIFVFMEEQSVVGWRQLSVGVSCEEGQAMTGECVGAASVFNGNPQSSTFRGRANPFRYSDLGIARKSNEINTFR